MTHRQVVLLTDEQAAQLEDFAAGGTQEISDDLRQLLGQVAEVVNFGGSIEIDRATRPIPLSFAPEFCGLTYSQLTAAVSENKLPVKVNGRRLSVMRKDLDALVKEELGRHPSIFNNMQALEESYEE